MEKQKSQPNESPTDTTSHALVEDVSRLKEDVAKLTADAKAHGRAQIDAVQERFNNAVAAAKEHLHSHPVAVLGAALLIGYIFGRRGRRRHVQD